MWTPRRFDFPGGKRFAFAIVDDTDDATVSNVRPLYELLERLGVRATKTVWPVACPEGSRNFGTSQTLEDVEYCNFVTELRQHGFEITWHCATMESSLRARTVHALRQYREILGEYPRIHVNHAENHENIYWGAGRVDSPLLRAALGRFGGWSADNFSGHVEASPYWWGDLCARHFTYARNLTTRDINTARFNPSMPYRDPARPLIPWWFSASDADDVEEFNALIHPDNLSRLEDDGGFCIVATHFGKRFVEMGRVNAVTRKRLEEMSQRSGWFPSTGELLDWLRTRRTTDGADGALPAREWSRMQRRWVSDRAAYRLRRHFTR